MRIPVLSCAALLLLTPVADARVSCPQLRDAKGDVREFWPHVGIPNDQLDIVSGDVAGDADAVAAQAGLVALADRDPLSPSGRAFVVIADVGRGVAGAGPFVGFSASFDVLGNVRFTAAEFSDPETGVLRVLWDTPAKGVVDPARRAARMWASYEVFTERGVAIRKGTQVRRLWVLSNRTAPAGGLTVDTGRAQVRYRIGSPACIPVGR